MRNFYGDAITLQNNFISGIDIGESLNQAYHYQNLLASVKEKSKEQIIVHEIPFDVNKANLVNKIQKIIIRGGLDYEKDCIFNIDIDLWLWISCLQ